MSRLVVVVAVGLAVVYLTAPSAQALPQFKKAFQDKYVAKDNEEYAAKYKKAGCNTCHVKGEKKTVRNEYGEELSKLIEGNAGQRIKDAGKESPDKKKAETETVLKELDTAFDKVAKMKTKAGPTYGDKIKEGMLPNE